MVWYGMVPFTILYHTIWTGHHSNSAQPEWKETREIIRTCIPPSAYKYRDKYRDKYGDKYRFKFKFKFVCTEINLYTNATKLKKSDLFNPKSDTRALSRASHKLTSWEK